MTVGLLFIRQAAFGANPLNSSNPLPGGVNGVIDGAGRRTDEEFSIGGEERGVSDGELSMNQGQPEDMDDRLYETRFRYGA